MKFRLLTILFLLGALAQVRAQGNSIYSIAPMAVCWTTDADVDSNLIAYWLFSSRETTPKVVSYLTASGTAVVVAGGTVQNGFCCCNSSQDTIGIEINGDTLILTQNSIVYTYIGGAGDDDWRWVDPGAGETMYEAIYRMGKASIFTEDTTHAFRVDSTFQFRVDGDRSIFDWSRGDSLLPEKTWLFRAPGGGTGQAQNDANVITIARTNATTTRTTVGKIKFASPFGVGDSLRTAAQIDVLDEEGGGDTTNTSINFYTRQLGEAFIRNTMTIEGNGRLELDRYNTFEDGVPERILGYDDTDKDVKVSDVTGNAQPGNVLGIDAIGTGMQWLDPDTLGAGTNLAFAGTDSIVNLNSSTGNGVVFQEGDNVEITQSGDTLLISGVGGGNGIFGVSDTVPAELTATLTDAGGDASFSILWENGSDAITFYDDGNKSIKIAGEPETYMVLYGSVTEYKSPNHLFQNSDNTKSGFVAIQEPSGLDQFVLTAPVLSTTIGLRLPPTAGSTGNVLTLTAPGVSGWAAPAAATANLTVSGTTPNFTISAGGTTMGVVAGNGMDGSIASNILTLNGLRSGTVNNGTGWTLLGTLGINSAGGNGLLLNNSGVHTLGQSGGNLFSVDPANNFYVFGSASTGTNATIRLYNSDGDLFNIRPPSGELAYTFVLPNNGDGATSGQVVTSIGGGATTFAFPPVYMTFTHTPFTETSIAADGLGAIVIPPDLDGYTIVSASYRTQSAVSGTGNIAVELVRTTSAGAITSGRLTGSILNTARYVTSTTNTQVVATGDLITCVATIGTATAEGLTITIELNK
ncbi:MAG: hypothetical protein ACKV1O_31030 [Saprospiraceae bacterium]